MQKIFERQVSFSFFAFATQYYQNLICETESLLLLQWM